MLEREPSKAHLYASAYTPVSDIIITVRLKAKPEGKEVDRKKQLLITSESGQD